MVDVVSGLFTGLLAISLYTILRYTKCACSGQLSFKCSTIKIHNKNKDDDKVVDYIYNDEDSECDELGTTGDSYNIREDDDRITIL